MDKNQRKINKYLLHILISNKNNNQILSKVSSIHSTTILFLIFNKNNKTTFIEFLVIEQQIV